MMALRKREKAAKLRRQGNQVETKTDDEEAGQIVAGPGMFLYLEKLDCILVRLKV